MNLKSDPSFPGLNDMTGQIILCTRLSSLLLLLFSLRNANEIVKYLRSLVDNSSYLLNNFVVMSW